MIRGEIRLKNAKLSTMWGKPPDAEDFHRSQLFHGTPHKAILHMPNDYLLLCIDQKGAKKKSAALPKLALTLIWSAPLLTTDGSWLPIFATCLKNVIKCSCKLPGASLNPLVERNSNSFHKHADHERHSRRLKWEWTEEETFKHLQANEEKIAASF